MRLPGIRDLSRAIAASYAAQVALLKELLAEFPSHSEAMVDAAHWLGIVGMRYKSAYDFVDKFYGKKLFPN